MAAYSVLFTFIVIPFWTTFQTDVNLLNQLQTPANNQDGNALKSLSSQLSQLTSDAANLATLPGTMLAESDVWLICAAPAWASRAAVRLAMTGAELMSAYFPRRTPNVVWVTTTEAFEPTWVMPRLGRLLPC